MLSHDLLLLNAAVVLQGDDDRVWRGLEQDSNIHHQCTLQFHQSIAIDINLSAVFSGNECINSRVYYSAKMYILLKWTNLTVQ